MSTPQDFTGTSPANLITETLYPARERMYVPHVVVFEQSPFFDTAGFSIEHTDVSGAKNTLVKDVDYTYTLPYLDGIQKLSKPVYGGVSLVDDLDGYIEVKYQTMGGSWIDFKNNALLNLARNPLNALTTWDVVSGTPQYIPVQSSTVLPDATANYSELIKGVDRLMTALVTKPLLGGTAHITTSAMRFRIAEHTNNYNNPHQTTLAQLGAELAKDKDIKNENPTDGVMTLSQILTVIANAIPAIAIPTLTVKHGLYETAVGSNQWQLSFTTSAFAKEKGKPTAKNGTLVLTNLVDPSRFATLELTKAEVISGVTDKKMSVPIVLDANGSGVTWTATLTYYANEAKAKPVVKARNIDDKYGVSSVVSVVSGTANPQEGRGFPISSNDSLDFEFLALRGGVDVDVPYTTVPNNYTSNLIGAFKQLDLDIENTSGSKSITVNFIGQYVDDGNAGSSGLVREYRVLINTASGDSNLSMQKEVRFTNSRTTFVNGVMKFTKIPNSRLWTVALIAADYGTNQAKTGTLAPVGYANLDVARFRSLSSGGWSLKIVNQPPDRLFSLSVRMKNPDGDICDYRLYTEPTVTSGFTDINQDMTTTGVNSTYNAVVGFESKSTNPVNKYLQGRWHVIGVRYDWSPHNYWFGDPSTSTDTKYCLIRNFVEGKRSFNLPYVAPVIPPLVDNPNVTVDVPNTSATGQGFITSGYKVLGNTYNGVGDISRVSFIDDTVTSRSNKLQLLNDKSASVSNGTTGWVIGGYNQFGVPTSTVSTSVEEVNLATVATSICQASFGARTQAASVSSLTDGYVICGLAGGVSPVASTLIFNYASKSQAGVIASAVAKLDNCGVMSKTHGYSIGGAAWTHSVMENEKLEFASNTSLGVISAVLSAAKWSVYGLSSSVVGKGYLAYGILKENDAYMESINFYTDTNIHVIAGASGLGSQRGSLQSHTSGYTINSAGTGSDIYRIDFLTGSTYTSASDPITRDFTTGVSANPWSY